MPRPSVRSLTGENLHVSQPRGAHVEAAAPQGSVVNLELGNGMADDERDFFRPVLTRRVPSERLSGQFLRGRRSAKSEGMGAEECENKS